MIRNHHFISMDEKQTLILQEIFTNVFQLEF
jgi:hypothetical protein